MKKHNDKGLMLKVTVFFLFCFSYISPSAGDIVLEATKYSGKDNVWANRFDSQTMALKEALLNALFHGSLEISADEMQQVQDRLLDEKEASLVEQRHSQPPYRDRKIFVDVRITEDEARFVVRDEGPGFNVAAVPDPSSPGALEAEQGRGLSLMRTFMDEVSFNDSGNEVTMVKRRSDEGIPAGEE